MESKVLLLKMAEVGSNVARVRARSTRKRQLVHNTMVVGALLDLLEDTVIKLRQLLHNRLVVSAAYYILHILAIHALFKLPDECMCSALVSDLHTFVDVCFVT